MPSLTPKPPSGISESQRTRLRAPFWRMLYLDDRINSFDTYVEIAMELHRGETFGRPRS